MIKMNYYVTLSAFLAISTAQTAYSIDISATGNEDPVMRICIEGETPDRTDYSLTEQIDACTTLIAREDDLLAAALQWRAFHYENSNRWSEAYDDYSRLIGLVPSHPNYRYRRARSALKTAAPSQSVMDDLSKAIELSADKPKSRYFFLRANTALFLLGKTPDPASLTQKLGPIHSDLSRAKELDDSGASKLQPAIRKQVDELLAVITAELGK